MKWSWADAWVLTAAYFTQENPVSLRSLVAAGDAINHAIFTDEELDHGLTRLSAAGLVRLDGETVVLTEAAMRLCEEAVKSTPYMLDGMEKIEAALREIDLSEKDFTPAEVSRSALHAAIEAYQNDAAQY